jgi:hypothetical protein
MTDPARSVSATASTGSTSTADQQLRQAQDALVGAARSAIQR